MSKIAYHSCYYDITLWSLLTKKYCNCLRDIFLLFLLYISCKISFGRCKRKTKAMSALYHFQDFKCNFIRLNLSLQDIVWQVSTFLYLLIASKFSLCSKFLQCYHFFLSQFFLQVFTNLNLLSIQIITLLPMYPNIIGYGKWICGGYWYLFIFVFQVKALYTLHLR